MHEAAGDQHLHVRREGRRQRRQAEDQQIDLVGEAAAVAVAEEAGDRTSPSIMPTKVSRDERRFCGRVEKLVFRVDASTPPAM